MISSKKCIPYTKKWKLTLRYHYLHEPQHYPPHLQDFRLPKPLRDRHGERPAERGVHQLRPGPQGLDEGGEASQPSAEVREIITMLVYRVFVCCTGDFEERSGLSLSLIIYFKDEHWWFLLTSCAPRFHPSAANSQ